MTSYYSREELQQLGFKQLGKRVQISRKTSIYNAEKISIGNNVRIDDFCILSAGNGGIVIGNYVHLAAYCSLQGEGKIELQDFSGLSSRVAVYSSNDDYTGVYLTNPTVPKEFSGQTHGDVIFKRHVIVGSGSVILPGVTLNEGVAIGALSMVNKDCEAFYLYKGNPVKKLLERKRDLLEKEMALLAKIQDE